MVFRSMGFSWAVEIANMESLNSGREFLEKDHLFIGVLSLDKIINYNIPEKFNYLIDNNVISLLTAEVEEIRDVFALTGFDRMYNMGLFRRIVRDYKGKANYMHSIFKGDESKRILERAFELAEADDFTEARCIHILGALIENPSEAIIHAFDTVGICSLEYFKTSVHGMMCNTGVWNNYSEDNSHTPFLNNHGTDLTRMARESELEQLVDREDELLQLIRTLSRKKKNNPIIIGEAGVGKTALIRGLACKIVEGNVPIKLRNKRIIEIDMGSIVAGTMYRGDFEEKLTIIIGELKKNPNIILFIDEIHTVIGAGSVKGGNLDASDIMKPALAQGDICCIGTTTLDEYRRYFEKDSAMERRFQPILVEEPTIEDTILILENMKSNYEKHHGVKIENSVIENAVRLSVRYLHDRKLPDKALDLLDEACSRKSIPHLKSYYNRRNLNVTTEDIAMVLEDLVGIPIKIGYEEKKTLLNLEKILNHRVIGQDEAIEVLAKKIRIARSGLQDPSRPYGVFLFLGPTGVGKTELAKTLAYTLFGSEDAMIRFDMSEFRDVGSTAKLIGAPPGYVGYGDEGQLTGALRTQPYSVVLLDEIEKADPKVFDLFLQVFDDGIITDGQGRTVDAKNAIFIMTSNLTIHEDTGFEAAYGIHEPKKLGEYKIKDELLYNFKPEFINRINDIIIFNSLSLKDIMQITRIMIGELHERLLAKRINLEVDDMVIRYLARDGYDPIFGARPLRSVIGRLLEEPLSEKIIRGDVRELDRVKVRLVNNNIDIEIIKSYNTSAVIS